MKSILKKTIAVLLVFSFVFAFAACNDDEEETTTVAETTVAATTASDDETTAVDETTVVDETTAVGETTTAAPGETTTAVAALKLPIGGTSAEVMGFYNQYGNAMKSYKGKVTVTKTDGTVSRINHIVAGKSLAEGMLPNDYNEKPTYTFVNGTSTVDGKTLSKWLPRDKSDKLSELSATGANGVKSATCTASGTGCKVVILMNDDIVSGESALNAPAKYVSKCMDTLDMKASELEPFVLEKATVNYTGCKIEAVFDDQGRMTKLDIATPAKIMGDLTWGIVKLKDTDITGDYKGNYTFAY